MNAPADNFVSLYVTASSREEATALGTALVSERLAACANVLGGLLSIYWWEGNVVEGDEVGLILKTRQNLIDAAIARLTALHSYSVPCIVAWPILGGNPDYLQWVADETCQPEEKLNA